MASFSFSTQNPHSPYQRRKAKSIVKLLMTVLEQSSLTRREMAKCISIMSEDEWRTVAFASGVAVADLPAKLEVLNMLRANTPRLVTSPSPQS